LGKTIQKIGSFGFEKSAFVQNLLEEASSSLFHFHITRHVGWFFGISHTVVLVISVAVNQKVTKTSLSHLCFQRLSEIPGELGWRSHDAAPWKFPTERIFYVSDGIVVEKWGEGSEGDRRSFGGENVVYERFKKIVEINGKRSLENKKSQKKKQGDFQKRGERFPRGEDKNKG
jgi:hypothetical protein